MSNARQAGPGSAATGSSPPTSTANSPATITSTGGGRLPEPQRHVRRREPQITLRRLPRLILGALRRIRRQEQRPQHPHPFLEHRHRPGPADPLRDHRRRHRRPRLQQLPDPRLDLVHDRTLRRPLILRRRLAPPTPDAPCSGPTPSCRAIARIGIPSARCSRRISAQSSTFNTSRSLRRVQIHPTTPGTFSRDADNIAAAISRRICVRRRRRRRAVLRRDRCPDGAQVRHFRHEAVGRVNHLWSQPDSRGVVPRVWIVGLDIAYHDTEAQWASRIYFGNQPRWWDPEAGLQPIPAPE